MDSIPDVTGNSQGSLPMYYNNMWTEIENEINAKDKETLRNKNIDELTLYFLNNRLLPILEIDDSKKPIMEELEKHPTYGNVTVKFGYYLKPIKGIDMVVSRRSSTYFTKEQYRLENCCLITQCILNSESSNADQIVLQELEDLKTIIQRKNDDVQKGNERLEKDTRWHIDQKKQSLDKSKSFLKTLAEKTQIDLVEKTDAPVIDLDVKQEIKVLVPDSKEQKDPELTEKSLQAVIKLIQNQGRSFQLTPKVFSTLEEEWLRDIILSTLNAVLEGIATGETFVKLGKTDIHLNIGKDKDILTGECKYWNGEKLYQETINQHFDYLTLRQNYAMQITFSNNKGFTDVCENAIKATEYHSTYISSSLRRVEDGYFITEHRHPEDSKKKIEFHHMLFNLFYERQKKT